MNVKSVERNGNQATIVVEIDKELMERGVNSAYMKARKSIMIPGFRKGKAPRKFVERMYGSEVFYEDAVNEIFPEIYKAAITEQEIKAVGQPSVTDMQTPEDGSVVLTVSTELYPEVTLGEYKGIEVPKESVSISKAEVDAELSRMQERNARIETVDREAKTGDTVVLDFEGFVDGKPFDGGKAEGYTLTLGSGAFIPGFEDQLAGMKAGDEKDVVVTFPENYTKELAGKEATFKCKIHEVKETIKPELDDEFAKDVSEFDTLAALKKSIKADLAAKRQEAVDRDFENEAVVLAGKNMTCDIPACMIDEQVDKHLEQFAYQLQSQGMNLDLYLHYTGSDMKTFRATFQESAERQVKIRLALEKIAEVEQLTASEEDIQAEYEKIAQNYGIDVEKVKGILPAAEIAKDVTVNKAIDLVKESAEVTEKKVKKTAAKSKKKAEGEAAEEADEE